MKFKHLIWDWNGTLLDDVDYCRRIINNILIENSLPELSINKYREIFTFPVKDYYEAAGLDFNKKSFEELGKQFIIEYEIGRLSCKLFDNSIQLLEELKNNGVKHSILSAYKHDSLKQILESYKIASLFDNIVGSDNIYASGKEHLGLQLIEKITEHPSEVLFVGDTIHDFEVAQAMGVDCVLIANGHQSKEKLLTTKCVVFENLFELKQYVLNKS